MHFSKKPGRLSLAGRKILAFGSHSMANFQPIFDCFIPNFKLKYEDSKTIKIDRVNTVILNVRQIKRWAFFYGTPGIFQKTSVCRIRELRDIWNLFNPYPLITVLDRI